MAVAHILLHRWSGWPGAWCLDCGIADPLEECLANDELDYFCRNCGDSWPQGPCPKGGDHHVEPLICPKHPVTPCEMAGSRMFDPYFAAQAAE